jgi:hypothetical protein
MVFPRDKFKIIDNDDLPKSGSNVALGCPHPDCDWVSSLSLVLDDSRPNEVWLALQNVDGEWRRHWTDNHQPAPLRLVEKKPEPEWGYNVKGFA